MLQITISQNSIFLCRHQLRRPYLRLSISNVNLACSNGPASSRTSIAIRWPLALTSLPRTALANKGHDTRALQAYLGRKNIQHTVRYTELSPDRFKDFWR